MDIKQNLLLRMEKILQSHGCKVLAIQAWGWFIRLLGGHVMKSRALVNQMLKIPEHTFADPDPQVVIASQVAWEALIDALIQHPAQAMADQTPTGKTLSPETVILTSPLGANCQSQMHLSLKNLKLLMTPLVGVMSSKCDMSVRLSCWKTWNYLLHNLDYSVNNPAIVSVVLDPIFKVVFETGPDNKNLWIWDLCMNLLEEFVALKSDDKHDEPNIDIDGKTLSPRTPSHGASSNAKRDSISGLPVKWLPWKLNQLEFLVNIVGILWKCGFECQEVPEYSSLTLNAALRIFRLIVRGVRSELEEEIKPLDQHVQAVHLILKFVQGLCQDIALKSLSIFVRGTNFIIFRVLEVVKDELRPSTLASSSYKVPLDFSERADTKGEKHSNVLCNSTNRQIFKDNTTTDMVAPVVYLISVCLNLIACFSSDASEEEKLLERLEKLTHIVSSGVNPFENFQALASILYLHGLSIAYFNDKVQVDRYGEGKFVKYMPLKSGSFFWFRVWKTFAKRLREHIEFVNDVALLDVGSVESGYRVIYSFLLFPLHAKDLYPFVDSNGKCSDYKDCDEFHNFSAEKEFDLVSHTWTMLYDSGNLVSSLKSARMNFFAEGFCKRALTVIDEEHRSMQTPAICGSEQKSSVKISNYHLRLFGGIAAHVLKQAHATTLGMLKINKKRILENSVGSLSISCSPARNEADDPSNVKNTLSFVARFLKLAWEAHNMNADCNSVMLSRVFDAIACFLNRLCTQNDILLFMHILSDPLSKWLCAWSHVEKISEEGSPVFKLERAWNQLLNCLQKSQPPMIFDSSLLNLQAPLLVAAFQHVHSPIANCTISFWEATYGNSSLISYPEPLVPVLDSLSQKVKITLPGWTMLKKGHMPLTYCSALCPNDKILEQANDLYTDSPKKVNIKRAYPDLEKSSTTHNQSVQNKATLIRENVSCADVDYQNITSCKGIKKSFSPVIDKITSCSLEGVVSSQERASVMTQKASISKGRKKLKFMEDSPDIDYVSIPSTTKGKLCSLTDHQREVKRAQRGSGMDTMGHGPGIKTYTGADFSHSQGNGDSEEPEELLLADIILDTCKK
eukprot:Gb_29910 [translate_table: standard]